MPGLRGPAHSPRQSSRALAYTALACQTAACASRACLWQLTCALQELQRLSRVGTPQGLQLQVREARAGWACRWQGAWEQLRAARRGLA